MHRPLLVAETILPPAIRAVPGNAVAGHPPEVFIHAVLTDGKAAATLPVETGGLVAAMAIGLPAIFFLFPVG